MQTLIRSQEKLKISSCENTTYQVKEKLVRSKAGLNFKLYQKLFFIFFAFCTFLIFPESPKESEVLCKKYFSQEACVVW